MLSSRFYWTTSSEQEAENRHSRARRGLLDLQKRRTKCFAEGHGDEVTAGGLNTWREENQVQRLQIDGRPAGQGQRKRNSKLDQSQNRKVVKHVLKSDKAGKGAESERLCWDRAQGEGPQTCIKRATDIARDREELNEAVELLKGNFWAASSKASQKDGGAEAGQTSWRWRRR